MKIEEIKQRVQEIAKNAGDPESAHSMEDELLFDFVRLIAEQDSEFSAAAKEVLKVAEIDFPRWCA